MMKGPINMAINPPVDATKTPEWAALQKHYDELQSEGISLKQWFADGAERVEKLSFDAGDLHFDLSKNLIKPETLQLFADLAKAVKLDERTKAIFAESMGNPTCTVPDLEGIARVAAACGVPFIVDNTFGAGGFLCNPLEWGANIICDSATKWINGHGTAMGGIIVDGGNFDWRNGRFPNIDGPSEGYHGLNLCDAFGNAAFIAKCRVDGLRDLGTCPSAFDSYLMALGLETLSLRASHQVKSARRIAEFLRDAPEVKSVSYIGFADNPWHANAARYFRFDGDGPVISAELQGDTDTTARFVEALQLAAHMTMIGDSITVVTHPASTTHKQLSASDLIKAGVTPTLLRISPGLEDPEDIINDFKQAFHRAGLC